MTTEDVSMYTMAPTHMSAHSDIPASLGFVAAAVAAVFFGSNFVPVKRFETGDGMFFQWVMCTAVWLTGLVVAAVRDFPKFYPLAMAGGLMWCTGNTMTVLIIKTVGLGQGILIWGSVNLLSGWVSGRFGLFGIEPEVPDNVLLNYIGMTLCLFSAFIYLFLNTETQSRVDGNGTSDCDNYNSPLLPETVTSVNHSVVTVTGDETFIDKLSAVHKRIIGSSASVIAGILYGLNFTPVIYIQDNYPNYPSQHGLDYVFSHFSGIFAASTFYFFLYCIYMRNKPRVYPKAVLPAMLSGVMWGIGQAAWFIANAALSEPVSFPIITTVPGIIGALWGIYFREIRGKRNILVMLGAFAITISGAITTAMSKVN
ncbi:hypothetical protein NP493_76g05027 [Ridgeia piscesae]|uniref:Transmembrane protein 144 n=1 Tax=Ridgeia piscesae TaxID=27915 RepID=A0AAD9P977_RIDPI|nr:hypothetical protein NP493_76g05027 [Ridgeia piscesae]